MKKFYVFGILSIVLLIFVSACRNPSLEQAIIDYNSNRNDQAYVSIQKAIKAVPEDPEAWFYYGEISGKKGEIQQMVDAFDKSLALKPTFKDQINSTKTHYFSKFYNSAVQTYNGYLKLEDKESESGTKALNSMIEDFNKSLIIKNDYQATRLSAIAYNYLSDEENHLKYLLLASEIKADTALSWIELGFFYRNKKAYEKAADYFKKAIDTDPQNTNANTMYAECLDFSGKKVEAIEAYKNAIKINPEEKAIPFNLGLLLYKEANQENIEDSERMKLLGEADTNFELVYNLDPEFKEIYDLYGPVLIYLEKFDTAEQVLLEGAKYFPDAAGIWTNLSIVYARQNKKDKANEAAKRAKELSNL